MHLTFVCGVFACYIAFVFLAMLNVVTGVRADSEIKTPRPPLDERITSSKNFHLFHKLFSFPYPHIPISHKVILTAPSSWAWTPFMQSACPGPRPIEREAAERSEAGSQPLYWRFFAVKAKNGAGDCSLAFRIGAPVHPPCAELSAEPGVTKPFGSGSNPAPLAHGSARKPH